MSDQTILATTRSVTDIAYDLSPRRAISDMSPQTRAAWRTRYTSDDGAELRIMALIQRAETAIRNTGEPTTIRTLWVALADRAAVEDTPDLRAAAGLAGMALGLAPS